MHEVAKAFTLMTLFLPFQIPVAPPPPAIPQRTEDDILDSESIPTNEAIEVFRHKKLDRINETHLNGSSAVVQELQDN